MCDGLPEHRVASTLLPGVGVAPGWARCSGRPPQKVPNQHTQPKENKMPPLMKSAGPPAQLLDTVKPSGKPPQRGGIPPAFESTIRAAEAEASDGETAGSEGLSGNLQPPSNGALDKALPGFSSLIPASEIHVP